MATTFAQAQATLTSDILVAHLLENPHMSAYIAVQEMNRGLTACRVAHEKFRQVLDQMTAIATQMKHPMIINAGASPILLTSLKATGKQAPIIDLAHSRSIIFEGCTIIVCSCDHQFASGA